jgi:glycerol-3-phosphate acyltransferase PlsY
MSPADWSGVLVNVLALAGGYLLGSIPFGLVLAKLAGLGDLRQIGSGNIGATNVLRAGAFLGHVFPVWLGFKGGKGVATYLGVLIGLYWPAALLFAATWLAVAYVTRYSSLAALTAVGASVLMLAAMGEWRLAALFVLLGGLLYIRHAENIGRLARGEETRIGEKR